MNNPSTRDCTTYCDGFLKIVLSPTSEEYKTAGFHRKRVGLNHLALYANSQEEIHQYYQNVMRANNIASDFDPYK